MNKLPESILLQRRNVAAAIFALFSPIACRPVTWRVWDANELWKFIFNYGKATVFMFYYEIVWWATLYYYVCCFGLGFFLVSSSIWFRHCHCHCLHRYHQRGPSIGNSAATWTAKFKEKGSEKRKKKNFDEKWISSISHCIRNGNVVVAIVDDVNGGGYARWPRCHCIVAEQMSAVQCDVNFVVHSGSNLELISNWMKWPTTHSCISKSMFFASQRTMF